jgi:hypothetical protein
MTAGGWIEGAKLVFQAKRRTGDYHGQMNFENFRRWFIDCLLPHIPKASLIVMDNAPYHNVYRDGGFYPTTSTRKADLQSWLQQNHPQMYQEAMIKAELVAVCRQLCPKPEYELIASPKQRDINYYARPSIIPNFNPLKNVGQLSKIIAQKSVITPCKDSEPI